MNSTEPSTTAVSDTDASRREANRFSRVWSTGLFTLILVTAPLWFRAPFVSSAFPRITWCPIPDLPWLISAIDFIAVGGLGIAVIVQLSKGFRRWCWALVGMSLVSLILLDQHRLQPWAYQSLLYAIVLSVLPWREARKWVIAISVSVYFYSAVGKLDFQFVHTVGKQMIQAIAQPVGGIPEEIATKAAFALPLAELSIAILLIPPMTRRFGGMLAIAMHVSLILLLGPAMLGHSLGVLVWNGLLAAQAWILFVAGPSRMDSTTKAASAHTPPPLVRGATGVLVTLALVMPLFERYGYWDHWTSWALYSPHNSRAEIQIHASGTDRLPGSVQHFLLKDSDGDRWRDLDIESWSLDRRRVPIYPQARYQLSLALQLAKQYGLEQEIRVTSKGVADRWTGERREVFLIGRSELEKELDRYWLSN